MATLESSGHTARAIDPGWPVPLISSRGVHVDVNVQVASAAVRHVGRVAALEASCLAHPATIHGDALGHNLRVFVE